MPDFTFNRLAWTEEEEEAEQRVAEEKFPLWVTAARTLPPSSSPAREQSLGGGGVRGVLAGNQ